MYMITSIFRSSRWLGTYLRPVGLARWGKVKWRNAEASHLLNSGTPGGGSTIIMVNVVQFSSLLYNVWAMVNTWTCSTSYPRAESSWASLYYSSPPGFSSLPWQFHTQIGDHLMEKWWGWVQWDNSSQAELQPSTLSLALLAHMQRSHTSTMQCLLHQLSHKMYIKYYINNNLHILWI